MPTVPRERGYVVTIFLRDHLPKHVHVRKGDARVIVNLEDFSVRDPRKIKLGEIADVQDIVSANAEFLLAEWDRIKPSP
jgi:uncharacterized protein YpmS